MNDEVAHERLFSPGFAHKTLHRFNRNFTRAPHDAAREVGRCSFFCEQIQARKKNMNDQHLHPPDAKRERDRVRRTARFQKMFFEGGDHLGRSQGERQRDHAAKNDREHRERAAFEKSLWNPAERKTEFVCPSHVELLKQQLAAVSLARKTP
jgi:hypothetical protein